ncbi:conjugal transfer protein MobA [Bacteroides reticulotermitis]|uniref:conjugal transfer protein MobA n=1 Tax=Bacteroides reticulotermitis TaxID=1133319 RepID=UPI003A88954F
MKTNKRKTGRLPKQDPAKRKHVFYLNEKDEVRFLSLFEQSGKTAMAHFITSCIFDKPLKVVKTDKGIHDYYMRLTTFFGQFRAIGNNYNQIVRSLNANFTEKKALAFLYKLEQATIDLVQLNKKIIALTADFEAKYLSDYGSENQ